MEKGRCTFQTERKYDETNDKESEPPDNAIAQEVGFNQDSTMKFDFLKNVFILDTGSTISATIMNENLVTDIRKTDKPIIMTTNAGVKVLDTEANVPNFGRAMFDTNQIANVFGFSHLSRTSE